VDGKSDGIFTVFSMFFVMKNALSICFIVVLFKWWYAYHRHSVTWWDAKEFLISAALFGT